MEHSPVNVVLIKNYEQQVEEEEAIQPQEEDLGIGTTSAEKRQQQEEQRERVLNYVREMTDLQKKQRRLYLECQFVIRNNQLFFLLVIVFQLLQSMGFNGVFDLPTLFMILVLKSLYAFRKSYFVFYQTFSLFVLYYIQFTVVLKLLYSILTGIGYVEEFMQDRSQNPYVKACTILFGINFSSELTNGYLSKKMSFYAFLLLCLFFAQVYRQCKWADIREVTEDSLPEAWSFTRLVEYMRTKEQTKLEQEREKTLISEAVVKSGGNMGSKSKKDSKQKNKSRAKSQGAFKKMKQDFNKYLPTLLLWVQRILLGFQSYMYHDGTSLLHLAWVLLSFIFPLQITLFVSFVVMLPFYTFEFVMVYGLRIPIVKDKFFFQKYGSLFDWEMKIPILEQTLYFVILTNFFMMISAFKLTFQSDQNVYLINSLTSKIEDKNSSRFWKLLFFVLKNIQQGVLILLFLNGANNLNHFDNLGFILFFVVYTTSEWLYRKTCKLLTIFISFFILGQYYFSLRYKVYMEDPVLARRMEWLNFYQTEKQVAWTPGSSIYFRHTPYPFFWFLLILMSLLNLINVLYVDKALVRNLTQHCYEALRNEYSSSVYLMVRIKNFVNKLLVLLVLVSMIYFIGKAQVNLISTIFFVLNILNLGFIAKGDDKASTLRHSFRVTRIIKWYSCFVLFADVLFICFIGEVEKQDQPQSWDQQFKARFPDLYTHLDFIGLRMSISLTEPLSEDEKRQIMKIKFYSYIAYLIMAIFLSNYFADRIKDQKADHNFGEDDWKRLFSFEKDYQDQAEKKDLALKRATTVPEVETRKEDEQTKFIQKPKYNHLDLLDHYEARRYTTSFMVYKMMDWWPYMDIVASYGHLLNNFIIVYLAINFSVSFYMFFNILCVCAYYSLATIRLHTRAKKNFRLSGLLTQTDLNQASAITKQYKIGAFFEFLQIRHKVWKIQFVVLIVACTVGFASTILTKWRERLEGELANAPADADPLERQRHVERIESVDFMTFWLFIAGTFKDHRKSAQNYFYFNFGLLVLGLVFERQAINWLTNRWGCTYSKLQKYIELDLRRDCIL